MPVVARLLRATPNDAGVNSPASLLVTQETPRLLSLLSTTQSITHWITDDVIFHFHRCPRRVFLDHFEDRARQDRPSDYLLKIRQDSISHRHQALQAYTPYHQPAYAAGDWLAGARATYALMQQGVSYLYKGVLVAQPDGGMPYMGQPDLLIRREIPSWLGDWSYWPVDIRLGKKPKQEYQLVSTFHAYLLSALQGFYPTQSLLLLKEKTYRVDPERQLPGLLALLEQCTTTLAAALPPEVFISRSRCDMCVWLPHCYKEAQFQRHLSLLPGVTPHRYRHLTSLGLTTVEALAQLSPTALALAAGFEVAIAEKLVHQAQATLQGIAIPRTKTNRPGQFPLTPQDIPSANIELYFDIEAAPDKDLVYLHGILVVDNLRQEETFIPLVAYCAEDEALVWQRFQYVVAEYPQAPIYHFCPYEAQTVRRLANLYGELVDVELLLTRFVDIHKCITEAATLPVESYALKHIARWIGFEWRDDAANGAQSICWYDNWVTTGDHRYMDAILQYNEDDCRATYWVKRWLTNFARPFWEEERSKPCEYVPYA